MTALKRSNSVEITINKRYRDWTVISHTGRNGKGEIMYLCRCVCGVEKQVRKGNLGNVIGCGCSRKAIVPTALSTINIGDKFNDWVVFSEAIKHEGKKDEYYLCQCVCGVRREVKRSRLGVIAGCGCIRRRSGFFSAHRKDLLEQPPAANEVATTKKTRSTKDAIPRGESTRARLEDLLAEKRLARELNEFNLDYEL